MLLNPNNKRESEEIKPISGEPGGAMINKDGTLNFQIFSKRSQIKQSQYQNQPKLENLLTNQNIVESEMKKDPKLNFYYGKKIEKSEVSIRGTITKEARTNHTNSGNIVGKFIKKGNANLLLNSRSKKSVGEDYSKRTNPVGSIRKEDSNGFGFSRRKEDTSLYKNSLNPNSIIIILIIIKRKYKKSTKNEICNTKSINYEK